MLDERILAAAEVMAVNCLVVRRSRAHICRMTPDRQFFYLATAGIAAIAYSVLVIVVWLNL
jgi:hypothetical protein